MNATPSRGLLAATTLMMLAFVASTAPAAALVNPEPPCLPLARAISPPGPLAGEVDTGKVHDALATINGGDGGDSDPTELLSHCKNGLTQGGGSGDGHGGNTALGCPQQLVGLANGPLASASQRPAHSRLRRRHHPARPRHDGAARD